MGTHLGLLHSSCGPLRGNVYTYLLPECLVLFLNSKAALSDFAIGFTRDDSSRYMFLLSPSD